MKLYIWNKDVLRDYGSGLAVALAESEDQARRLLWDKLGSDPDDPYSEDHGLSQPPDEVVELTQPYAIYIYGSQ